MSWEGVGEQRTRARRTACLTVTVFFTHERWGGDYGVIYLPGYFGRDCLFQWISPLTSPFLYAFAGRDFYNFRRKVSTLFWLARKISHILNPLLLLYGAFGRRTAVPAWGLPFFYICPLLSQIPWERPIIICRNCPTIILSGLLKRWNDPSYRRSLSGGNMR